MCRKGAVSELAARVTGVVRIRWRVCSLVMGRAFVFVAANGRAYEVQPRFAVLCMDAGFQLLSSQMAEGQFYLACSKGFFENAGL